MLFTGLGKLSEEQIWGHKVMVLLYYGQCEMSVRHSSGEGNSWLGIWRRSWLELSAGQHQLEPWAWVLPSGDHCKERVHTFSVAIWAEYSVSMLKRRGISVKNTQTQGR